MGICINRFIQAAVKNQAMIMGRQSPIKRERDEVDSESPLPKMMRNMPGGFPNFNPAALPGLANRSATSSPPVSSFDPKNFASSPLSAAAILNSQKESNPVTSEPMENVEASEKRSVPTPAGASAANSNAQSVAAAAALGRLFPGLSANMGAKLNVNGESFLTRKYIQ